MQSVIAPHIWTCSTVVLSHTASLDVFCLIVSWKPQTNSYPICLLLNLNTFHPPRKSFWACWYALAARLSLACSYLFLSYLMHEICFCTSFLSPAPLLFWTMTIFVSVTHVQNALVSWSCFFPFLLHFCKNHPSCRLCTGSGITTSTGT